MSDWSADDNPYEVLGLPLESTKEQHKKVHCCMQAVCDLIVLAAKIWYACALNLVQKS